MYACVMRFLLLVNAFMTLYVFMYTYLITGYSVVTASHFLHFTSILNM